MVVQIADTGNGISGEVAATPFTPFATIWRRGMVTGLSISRIIVEEHGGQLFWSSVRAEGSSSWFTQPTRPAEKARKGHAIVRDVPAALESVSEAQVVSDEDITAAARIATLSVRERKNLQGMVAGRQSKVITPDLGISPHTVETYHGNVMTKPSVQSVLEVGRMALAASVESGNNRVPLPLVC